MTVTTFAALLLAGLSWPAWGQSYSVQYGACFETAEPQLKINGCSAYYNSALGIEANRPYSMFGRGIARRRKGDIAGGNADMAVARQQVPGIADEFARYGVTLQ